MSNPLFAVNYLDRQIRKSMGEHVREAVKQGREVNCQMERLAIFIVAYNFLTPHRIRDGARVSEAGAHADVAGLDSARYAQMLERIFTHRYILGHMGGNQDWHGRTWRHQYENPPAVNFKTGEVSAATMAVAAQKLPQHLLV